MVTINIGRKEAVFFGVIILIFAVAGLAIAIGSDNWQVHGHDAGELNISGGHVTCRTTGTVNAFDKASGVNCGEGYLAGVTSYHVDSYEDRRYSYKCCFPEGTNPDTMTTCTYGTTGTSCTPSGW